jgi:hypothetical protein
VKLDRAIEALVTQVVARDVAAGVELARSIGYAMPKDFDVGVAFHEEADGRTRIRMRLDDTRYDSLVVLPHLDGRTSMQRNSEMWEAAWQRIHTDAITIAHVWIDKHPEAKPRDATQMLSLLDAMKADEDLSKKWMMECEERAKRFTYTPAVAELVRELEGG